MTTPLPLWHRIVLEQMLVGAAASLVNLIIHAVLLGAVVWTVRGLAQKDRFVPGFVQYTVIIVATGTLLMTGHFVEVGQPGWGRCSSHWVCDSLEGSCGSGTSPKSPQR
jgi:hypothetical protein